QTRVNPHLGCQLHPPARRVALLESLQALHKTQPRLHRAPRVVFVRLGPPKVHYEAIPLRLGNMPGKLAHDIGAHGVIVSGDLEQGFGVLGGGELRQTQHMTDDDSELAALGSEYARPGGSEWAFCPRCVRWECAGAGGSTGGVSLSMRPCGDRRDEAIAPA